MKEKDKNSKQPFKLDGIDKKVVYTVPDDYFKELPGIIQSRVVKPQPSKTPLLAWSTGLKYALPIAALIFVVFYFAIGFNDNKTDVVAMIDEVSTEELISYLDESDISTDELISMLDFNEFDVDGLINDEIELLNEEEWDELLDEYPDFEDDI